MKTVRSETHFRFSSIWRAISAVLFIACAAPLSADVLFLEDFETPNVPSYAQGSTPETWVRASAGFGAGDHGMTDKSGGDFSAPAGNHQAYAFRYTNSGITSADKALGSPLAFGGGYEVSFNVVKDNSNGGRDYSVKLIAFGAGAARNDCRSTPAGSTVLTSASGTAPADGSITTVTFTFIPNATTHAAEFGKDLGIRVLGSSGSALVDNIKLRAIPGTGSGLNLVTTNPVDDSVNNLISKPLRAFFSKNIIAGTGSGNLNITLRNLTDMIDTVIPVSDPRIVISGVCMDILPGAPLTWGKNYAVLIDPDALVQNPGGTPFAGIADDTTWNFGTAGGDPLFYSVSRLKDHINGVITLSAAEINTIKLTLDSVVSRFAESSASITALLDLIATYDTVKGPLWVARGLPKRTAVTNDLHWTIFNVMQNIMERIYTAPTLAAHETLLNGFKFGSSANFPGACAVPAPNTHTATISASYLNTYGPATLADGPGTYARKPTGTYLAPGSIATVTVPPSMVGTGYKIRVGSNSPDFSAKPDIKRLDRVTRVYDISALQTKVASPLGGGIYIEVPFLASAGVVNVDISNAVRSPYFSAKSFHTTTPAQWLIERAHPAPWADFQSDKFMMQVPKSWISAMPDPTPLMANWDAAMDAMNDLMGYPHVRGKETMYPQVDLLLKNSVYAPGYPSINTTYSPTGNYGGYANSHLVRGPQFAPDYEFHEQGHAYTFPKFGGESESNVNLHHVAIWNRKFGYSLDESFRKSRSGYGTFCTLETTAMAWMCVFNFSPREVPMADGEKAYQLKGHAKFVDIAKLYGWGVLGDFWGSMVDEEESNIAYSTSTDSLLLRLSKSVGKDIRPLFHFWGIHPQNPATLASAIAAEGLLPDLQIRDRLLHYKTLVPANNAAFRTFALGWWGKQPSINGNWEEREHARQWDTTALYGPGDQQRSEATNPGEIYNENSANDIRNRVQELVDLYFPDVLGPNPMSFASVPSAMNATTITMTATTATSPTGPIQYYFENTTSGTNSGWIIDKSWTNTGLANGQSYNFRVKARDGTLGETGWSAVASATATADVSPPTPNPMTFAAPPAALSDNAITMTATAASDINGVTYLFHCTAGGGPDSLWQSSLVFDATGLSPSTAYTYVVRAKDSAGNTTADSAPASATTAAPDTTPPTISTLSPADNASNVAVDSSLVATFSENIGASSGSVIIANLTDFSQTAIDIHDPQVTIAGATLTINPSFSLKYGRSYAVWITPTAIRDLATNPFAGIANDTTWNFTTVNTSLELFRDNFEVAGGTSLTDPAGRATGTLASAVKYAWTNTADIVVNGTLDWDSDNTRDGQHQHTEAGAGTTAQNFYSTFNWAPHVAGKVWEVSFDQRVGWSSPLTFGLADTAAQTGNWAAWSDANYDFAAGSFGSSLYFDTDNADGAAGNTNTSGVAAVFPGLVAANPPTNQIHQFRIRFNEPAGTVAVLINGVQRLSTTGLDFENAGRYLSWGEPSQFAGALDNLAVRVINTVPFWDSNPVEKTDAQVALAYSASLDENVNGIDPGGNLIFAKVAGPAWLNVAADGTLSGTPTNANIGLNAFTVSVSDGIAPAAQATLNINVLSGGGGVTFADYISDPAFGINPAKRGVGDDPDGDNLANGIEAWFGTHPGQINAGLTDFNRNGNTITFTHPHNENAPGDLSGTYQWSPNLDAWYLGNGVAGPPAGPTVIITSETTGATTTVTATTSVPLRDIFFRARVIQN